jgi:site-specific recombinase XerD
MAHLSRWLAGQGLDVRGLGAAEVALFFEARRRAGYTNHRFPKALQPMLEYLRRLGVAPSAPAPMPVGPVETLLKRYGLYLTIERGLTSGTVRGYQDAIRPFLQSRASTDGLALESLTAAEVAAFVVGRCRKQSPGSARMTVTALRSMLGFLHVDGLLSESLAQAVPSVASRRLVGLPKGLEPGQVGRLLSSCDRRTALGRRDFAVLTVLVRLGLRAGELAGLELGDISWRSGEVLVRGKGRESERMPLPADVGEAVAAYLRRGRPRTAQGRSVFVRSRAPHRALSSGGVTAIVRAAGRRAGLGSVSAHRLRHTAATELLRTGAPLSEIGQLLRHRRAITTAIYAKADREALRVIARRWPGDSA